MSLAAVAVASARARRGLADNLWDTLAYAGRYGMQPLSVLYEMTLAELSTFVGALSKIVREENESPKER